jgi:Fuc2NAc and GlcNAc transferase
MMNQTVIIFFSSILLGALGAWVMAIYGSKIGFIDRPNERSSHQNNTPKGGGIGILAGFIIASLVLSIPAGFWIPATLISLLSLFGDYFHIAPRLRLFFQFAVTIFFLLATSINGYESMSGYLRVIPLSFYIVGTANFFNFMDGIDGIAGFTGFVGFGLLAFYGFSSGTQPTLVVFNISIALGCLGFLPFNIPKAKVFMGDVGSVLLGFLYAAIVVQMSETVLIFLCLSSFLFPFYIDELTTMVVRIRDGQQLTRPHRRHLYQILANEYEISHWKVSLGYCIFQLVVGYSIFAIRVKGTLAVLSLLFLYGCIFISISLLLRKRLAINTITN